MPANTQTGDVNTNSVESFWALLKRGYHGTYQSWSPKHLQRHVNEFVGRHNLRCLSVLQNIVCVPGNDRKSRNASGLLRRIVRRCSIALRLAEPLTTTGISFGH